MTAKEFLGEEAIAGYREGYVSYIQLRKWGCCRLTNEQDVILHYIEVIFENGDRKFIYDDQKGFEIFRDDFRSRRFTSFHEFWTTEELAEEKRDLFALKYYVPRGEDSYLCAPAEEVYPLLGNAPRGKDRMTILHKYDKKVNYHLDDPDEE